MSEPATGPAGANSKAPKRRGWLRGAALGAAFAATFAAGGVLMSGPAAVAMQMAMDHMGGMGGEGHMGAMGAAMHAHIAHMLDAVDATPDQKAKIHEIMTGAMAQLKPLHAKVAATPKDLHAILTAPTVDRAALEQLRADRLADADQASRVLVQALADAADVLTPEQRAKLGAAMAHHHMEHMEHPKPQ